MAKKKRNTGPFFISEGAGIIEIWHAQSLKVVKNWFYNTVQEGIEALAEAEAMLERLNYWQQSVFEKHRFLTEAFGIPDETDGKEQSNGLGH